MQMNKNILALMPVFVFMIITSLDKGTQPFVVCDG